MKKNVEIKGTLYQTDFHKNSKKIIKYLELNRVRARRYAVMQIKTYFCDSSAYVLNVVKTKLLNDGSTVISCQPLSI